MRLLRPSPGEVADRQTILFLKIQACIAQMKDASKFVDENAECQRYLDLYWFKSLTPEQGKQFDDLLEELAKVNKTLWDLEDKIRVAIRLYNNEDILTCAIDIPKLNDERADIVRKINMLWGDNQTEKIYAK